ncbi:DUF494 family protein [bacterium]|nr:DUF494 family protein [bacterium]
MNVFQIADSALVDIILYFAEQMANGVKPDNAPEVQIHLLKNGYSRKQIENAILVFREKIENRHSEDSVRIFSSQELSNFTPDSKKLFVRLYRLKVLTFDQIEAIIWRTSMFNDEEVSVDELKIIAAMMLSQPDFDPIPPGFFVPHKDEIQN